MCLLALPLWRVLAHLLASLLAYPSKSRLAAGLTMNVRLCSISPFRARSLRDHFSLSPPPFFSASFGL